MSGLVVHPTDNSTPPALGKLPLYSFSSVAVPLGMTVIPMIILIPAFYTVEMGLSLASVRTGAGLLGSLLALSMSYLCAMSSVWTWRGRPSSCSSTVATSWE